MGKYQRLFDADNKYIKEVYKKIKELKEEIEFTQNNELITDEVKKAKYINSLNVELMKCYNELKFVEKQQNILDNKDAVDDYLDKKGQVKHIDFRVAGSFDSTY